MLIYSVLLLLVGRWWGLLFSP